MQLPPPDNLSNREKKVPYVFIADDAFPLREDIMKLYSGLQQKALIKRLYNYRICLARRVVVNVFGSISRFKKTNTVRTQKTTNSYYDGMYLSASFQYFSTNGRVSWQEEYE